MTIRNATQNDHKKLVMIWEASVRESHHFLTEGDILSIRQELASAYLPNLDVWVHENENTAITGFIGTEGNKIEMLFISPEHQRRGIGTALLDFIRQSHEDIFIDVNKDNPAAHQFYLHYGFNEIGYSPCDPAGRPFPIVHLQR